MNWKWWNGTIVAKSEVLFGILLHGLRKSKENSGKLGQYPELCFRGCIKLQKTGILSGNLLECMSKTKKKSN
jgi:hypothetical protein